MRGFLLFLLLVVHLTVAYLLGVALRGFAFLPMLALALLGNAILYFGIIKPLRQKLLSKEESI